MVLRGASATSFRGALEGVGPENRDFFGPWNGTSEANFTQPYISDLICISGHFPKNFGKLESIHNQNRMHDTVASNKLCS